MHVVPYLNRISTGSHSVIREICVNSLQSFCATGCFCGKQHSLSIWISILKHIWSSSNNHKGNTKQMRAILVRRCRFQYNHQTHYVPSVWHDYNIALEHIHNFRDLNDAARAHSHWTEIHNFMNQRVWWYTKTFPTATY